MSLHARRRSIGHRTWFGVLAAGVLLAGAAGSVASAAPDETIDAGSNASAAAQALNGGCDDISNCNWETDASFDPLDWTDYGDPRIIGDVLYNCSVSGTAKTAVNVEDTRGDATSISESVSGEVSVGILGIAKASVGFTVSSGQSTKEDVSVSNNQVNPVPAGYKGWTTTSILSGKLSGSVFIDQGGSTVEVKGIDLTYAGWRDDQDALLDTVVYSSGSVPMTEADIQANCNVVGAPTPIVPTPTPTPTAAAAHAAPTGHTAQAEPAMRKHALPEKRYRLTVCRPREAGPSARRAPRCVRRTVKGVRPHDPNLVTARLERAGRLYATETDRRGIIRLTQRRTITPGRYRLVLEKKPRLHVPIRSKGKLLHKGTQRRVQYVPLTIGWTRQR